MMLMTLSMVISTALIFVNFVLAKKEFQEREKPSAFECGFDPMCSARLPFSIQFFLVTVIFLIFDVEITLILPSIQIINSMNLYPLIYVLTTFTIILLIGLYLEWQQGSLDWFF